jgi:hypothetical protein
LAKKRSKIISQECLLRHLQEIKKVDTSMEKIARKEELMVHSIMSSL